MSWSDGGLVGLDVVMRAPEKVDCLFAFAGQYNVSNAIPSSINTTTFHEYQERAVMEFKELSPCPGPWNEVHKQEEVQMLQTEPT